jgi:ABC-2 type transport system permease protein
MSGWALRMYAVMAKEFTQLRRDRVTYAMILLMPLIQLILFGYAINTDPRGLPAAVVAHDQSALADDVVATLERTTYVEIRYRPNSEAEMDSLMRQGKILLALTIPPDFSERVIKRDKAQILAETDASDPQSAAGVIAAVSALPSEALRHDLRGPVARPQTSPPFEVVVHRMYNPEGISAYNIVPGLLGIILSMTLVMMTAMAVTRELERGTMESLLSTPATPLEIMVGKLAPYVLVGMVQTCVVLLAARLLFDVPMADSAAGWLSLVVGILLFIVGNLALGYLVSTLARSQLQAMQMSMFYMLPSIFLSGFAFPFYGLPAWGRAIGEVIPVTHILRIVRGALLKHQHLPDMIPSLVALMLFITVVGSITLMRARTTLD